MAKKQKYDASDAPVQETQTITAADVGTVTADAPKGNPQFVKKPGIFLQDSETGVQYKFDRRELPKKAAIAGNILIDGVETPFQVTSNKGWTPENTVIEYIWVNLPPANEGEPPIPGYITLDYLVPAASFAGKSFTQGEGEAERKNPERVPKSVEAEEKRKAAAKATLEAKKLAAEATKPAEGEAAQPEGEATSAS